MRESVPFGLPMGRSSRLIRRTFAVASVAWAGALPAATMLASRQVPRVPEYLAAAFVYAVGSLVCHQQPVRSFVMWGRQMPVCARCAGIYAGAAVASLLVSIVPRVMERSMAGLRASRSHGIARLNALGSTDRLGCAIVAAVPTLATLVFEWTTGRMPANVTRGAAGFFLGAVVAALVMIPGGRER